MTLTLLFKFVPQKNVKWKSAMFGAVFSALLWEATKHGFNYYVQNISNMKILYGSFILLPLFLIWINFSWIIVLAGAQLSFVHQHLDVLQSLSRKRRDKVEEEHVISPYLGVYIMTAVVRAFIKGEGPLRMEELEKTLKMDYGIMEPFIEKLLKSNYLLSVNDEGGLMPARETETIRVKEIIECFEIEQHDRSFPAVSTFIRDMKKQRFKWAGETSIKDLAESNWKSKTGNENAEESE